MTVGAGHSRRNDSKDESRQMNDAHVNFLHYEAELSDDALSCAVSNYWTPAETRRMLIDILCPQDRIPSHNVPLVFTPPWQTQPAH